MDGTKKTFYGVRSIISQKANIICSYKWVLVYILFCVFSMEYRWDLRIKKLVLLVSLNLGRQKY